MRRAGWSIREIARDLGLSKSTASLWVREIEVSAAVRAKLKEKLAEGVRKGGNATRLAAGAKVALAVEEARGNWDQLSQEPLFMLGIGIYMGEGSKRSCSLGLSNSDAGIVRAWIRWCRAYAGQAQFRARLVVHGDEQKEAARKFWEGVLGTFAPVTGVQAYVSAASKRRRPVDRLPNGTLTIDMRTGSRIWHAKMMQWIRMVNDGVKA